MIAPRATEVLGTNAPTSAYNCGHHHHVTLRNPEVTPDPQEYGESLIKYGVCYLCFPELFPSLTTTKIATKFQIGDEVACSYNNVTFVVSKITIEIYADETSVYYRGTGYDDGGYENTLTLVKKVAP
jgi:hypothetical protein